LGALYAKKSRLMGILGAKAARSSQGKKSSGRRFLEVLCAKRDKEALECTTAEFKELFNTNVFGTYILTRELARSMIRRKAGAIVFITSATVYLGMTKRPPPKGGGFKPGTWKLNHHRLKAVGFLAAESRVEAKAS
jgi:NAD(P)-dependent dehydrogenase (short-subunit alcohol dehydrogenase family)